MAGSPARIALLAGLSGLCGCVPGPPPIAPPFAAPPFAAPSFAPPPFAPQTSPRTPSAAPAPAATPIALTAPSDPAAALAAQGFDAAPSGGAASALRLEIPDGVLFDSASDQPHPEAADILRRLAAAQAASRASLTVLGHTDAIGSDSDNLALSARRARTVIALLVADGVPPEALSAVAIGRRQPVAPNTTAEGRARNRRVEFLLGDRLDANLDAVRASGSGDVALLRPDAHGGPALIEAERITLPEPLHETHPDPQTTIRLRRPDPVSRAPLRDTPSF